MKNKTIAVAAFAAGGALMAWVIRAGTRALSKASWPS